jgi:hypothetical protein
MGKRKSGSEQHKKDYSQPEHRASFPGTFRLIEVDESCVPRRKEAYDFDNFDAAKRKAEELSAKTSVARVFDEKGECLFSAGEGESHMLVIDAPFGTKFSGRVSDAAFHEAMLNSKEGEDASDLAAIHFAVEHGYDFTNAVRLFANPRLRKRLLREE